MEEDGYNCVDIYDNNKDAGHKGYFRLLDLTDIGTENSKADLDIDVVGDSMDNTLAGETRIRLQSSKKCLIPGFQGLWGRKEVRGDL